MAKGEKLFEAGLHGLRSSFSFYLLQWAAIFVFVCVFLTGRMAFGQADQGAITGIVTDSTGASIAGAQITLTNVDTGLVQKSTTDASGVYTFSPVKIGHYTVSATANGFAVTNQTGLQLNVQQRLEADLQLQVGSVSQQVEVTTAPPLLQTEDASVGQVVSTDSINNTPLNGRNWVFIAQLAAGTNGVATSSRTAGSGTFSANGQRIDMDNFMLDGVDNNNNVVDFLNGAVYSVRPPPDALAEFKVQTSNYSAEFGHAAGAVVNASIKSGTNQIHGDLWEYVRNTSLTARDWEATSVQPYHENQFGATLGLPVIKNKLFFFGDTEANRIALSEFTNLVVPTARMRVGDFGELNTGGVNLFTGGAGLQLFNTNAAGAPAITNNDLRTLGTAANTPGKLSPAALNILSLYPCPTITAAQSQPLIASSGGNCPIFRPATDNIFQFDTRVDYDLSATDQAFIRFSLVNERAFHTPQLGKILDGGSFGDDGSNDNLGENTVFSETHVFTPSLTNEFRMGYNFAHYSQVQVNATNPGVAASLGLGGLPTSGFQFPGGLPAGYGGGQGPTTNLALIPGLTVADWGTPSFMGTSEHLDNFQVLDNLTKVAGNHTLKFGVNIEYIRFITYQPPYPRGEYLFNGQFTSAAGGATGSALADFMLDQMSTGAITQPATSDQLRWDSALFAEDDWKVTRKLTLNLGLRWEDPTAYRDLHDRQANFAPTGPLGVGTGTANYLIPVGLNTNLSLGPNFPSLAAANNVTIAYVSNPYLVSNAWKNFDPRLGLAYQLSHKATIRAGFGLFHTGLENIGYGPNIGQDFPFLPTSNFVSPTCKVGNCTPAAFSGTPITLENGFTGPLGAPGGIVGSVTSPTINAVDPHTRIPYTEDYNLSAEYAIKNNTSVSVAYVGSQSHRLTLSYNINNAYGLAKAGTNINPLRAFPGFGTISAQDYLGQSSYNSLQVVLQHRYSNGLTVSSNYTYAHSLGVGAGLVGGGGTAFLNSTLVPIKDSIAESTFDVRHRFTFNGNYELPFGVGRKFANSSNVLDYVIGGWAASATYIAQTGEPVTIGTTAGGGWTAAAGASTSWALEVGNPFQGGGTPPPNNPLTSCPATVHNLAHWYNPCAFTNPAGNGATIPTGTTITGAAALPYFGSLRPSQIVGPGYNRMNFSLFKNFKVHEKITLQFRTDVFNLLNHPTWAAPAFTGLTTTAGKITGPLTLQTNAPDARFFQLSMKLLF